jgi:hypothetical protein
MLNEAMPLTPETPAWARLLLVLWGLILMPWFPAFCMIGTGMAFEGGYTPSAYMFVALAWCYPAFVVVAFLARRRRPALVLLPIIPLVTIPFSG